MGKGVSQKLLTLTCCPTAVPIIVHSKQPNAAKRNVQDSSEDEDDIPVSNLAKKRPPSSKQAGAAAKKARASGTKKPAPARRLSKGKAPGNGKGQKKTSTVGAKKRKKAEEEDEDEEDEDDDDRLQESSGEDEEEEDEEDEDMSESEEEEESEEDGRVTKKKVSAKKKTKGAVPKKTTTKAAPKTKRKPALKSKKPTVKKEAKGELPKTALSSKAVRIEQAMKAFKWWDQEPLPQGIQWRALEHNGIFFPPDYVPHGVKMLYDGKEVELPSDLEEVATFFASMPPDGPQLGHPDTRKIFVKNFFGQFKEMLKDKLEDDLGIKDFDKCDFSPIRAHLETQKMIKKAATVEEKALVKAGKEERQDHYGYAIVDGRIEKVGNFNMEPPGLFRGRGMHPLMGMIKERCLPENIIVNLGPDARVPPCPLPGHAWDRVQHDNKVTWLASWKENVLNGVKYVMLAASSSFKGKSDMEKYDKAARLKQCIGRIRRDYEGNLGKKADREAKQIATAMWIIDKLALRVGGEKGEDEADTVGCCSLRLEHLRFPPPLEDGGESSGAKQYEIELEFLGKDSMLFKQTIDFASYGENGKQVFKNLRHFVKDKKPEQDVFEMLTPSVLNAHLGSLMPGLSAKVFRTYNASETLQNELPTVEDLAGMSVGDKVVAYNDANRKVAILCNHQRTVTKTMETALGNLQERLQLLKDQKKELLGQKELLKSGKTNKIRTRKDDVLTDKAVKAMDKAEDLRKKAATPEEKIKASHALDEAKELKRQAQAAKAKDAHLFARPPTKEQVDRKIEQWREKITKLELDIRNKDENKEVALGTSKINYMDPRISVAWCKRVEVPIERIFAKTLRDKFVWAMGVPPSWRFEGTSKPEM